MSHPKVLELANFFQCPSSTPKKLLEEITRLIDPNYICIGLADICGEGAIMKMRNARGEPVCIKIAMPNIVDSYEDVSLLSHIIFKKDKRNLYSTRFLEGAKIQHGLNKTLLHDRVNYFYVPAVYKYTETPFLYYEMEWLESVKILDWIKNKKSLKLSMDLFMTLLDAIDYCHGKAVIHRDIKSDNILIWKNNSIALLDWTISKKIDDDSRDVTIVGTPLGTFPYATKKMIMYREAKNATYSDDIHQLGYVFYEFYKMKKCPKADQETREDENKIELYRLKLSEDIGEPFKSIFLKATETDEKSRYQLVEEFKQDLKLAIKHANFKEDDNLAINLNSRELFIDNYIKRKCDQCQGRFCNGTKICARILKETFNMMETMRKEFKDEENYTV